MTDDVGWHKKGKGDSMSLKSRFWKKILASSLVCSMVVSLFASPADAVAREKSAKKAADAQTEAALKQKLADIADSSEYPNGMIAFGESQMTGAEGQDSELLVVRAGGTEGKAKVTLKAIDISAKYGEDYLLTVKEGKKKTVLESSGNAATLMEQYGDNLTIANAGTEDSDTDTESSEGKDAMAAMSPESVEFDELSGLQKAAAMQNDGTVAMQKSWREVNDKESSDYTDAEQLITEGKGNLLDAVKDIDGVEYTFTFEEGEYKKAIDISVIDDALSEGDEQIMFILSDASGAELSDSYTAYFNIKDNEDSETNIYEMESDAVSVERGTESVALTVNKTSGTEKLSVLTVGTSALTAKAGTDYETVNTALVFAPGMTSKTVTIPLITDDREETGDVSFYVGLESEDGVVNSAKNATLVTIKDAVSGGDVVYEEKTVSGKKSAKTGSDVSTKASKELTVLNSTRTIIASNGKEAGGTVASGLDLRTASRIQVYYYSNYGSTKVKSGCKTKTVSNRKVTIKLGSTNIVQADAVSFGSSSNVMIAQRDLKSSDKKSNMSLAAYVQGTGGNKNAELSITKVVVTYPGYTVSMNNSPIDSRGQIVSSENAYQEILYTGAKASTKQGNPFRLGIGYVKKASDSTFYYMDEALSLTYAYDQNSKTSTNVTPNKENTAFVCFQIYNASTRKWQDITETKNGKSITLQTLLGNYSSCMDSGNRFTLRPKFSVNKANIKFLNNSTVTVAGKKVKQSDAGEFTGFDNNSSFKDATLLDTIQIAGTPHTGYSVCGFSVYTSKKQIPYTSTSRASVIKLTPSVTDEIKVDMNYEESKIEVIADPSGQNTDKGAVLYNDPNDAANVVSGDSENVMSINGAAIGSTYNIIGLASAYEGDSNIQYRAVWRDGTLDVDGDGVISSIETGNGLGYNGFSPVSGNVLSFSPSQAYTKVYYDFAVREAVTKKQDIAYLMGNVSLRDTVLFSGETTETQLNGVNVVADGDTAVTSHTDGDKYTEASDGYYQMDGGGTYYAYDYMLVTFTYNAPDGSVMTANVVSNPNLYKEVVFSSDSVMSVDSAEACYVKTDSSTKEEQEVGISYKEIDNGDYTYRLKFHVTSKNTDLQPRKGILRFYTSEGQELTDKTITQEISASDSGNFSFDFNPKDLELAAGTTITFQVQDQNDTLYYERQTGIQLTEAIGLIDFVNSFEFGGSGTVVKLMGNIDSQFDLGWSGNFDSKSNENIVVEEEKDEDGNVIGSYMTLALGFSTGGISKDFDIKSVEQKATKKAEAQEAYLEETLRIGKKNVDKVTDKDKEKLDKLKQEMENAAKEFDDELDTAANPKKTTTKVASNVTADVTVSLALRFALDEEKSSYYFDSMVLNATVTAGAGVDVSFATPIGVTISLGFSIGVDNSGATFVIAQREDIADPPRYYLTSGEEDSLKDEDGKINLFDFSKSIDNPYTHTGVFDVNPYVTLTAGAGVLGDMVKVSVTGKAQFYMTFYTDDTQNTGDVNLSASIGVKVLFISASWPFVSKDVHLFGNTSTSSLGMDELNYLHDSSEVLRADDKEYLANRSKWNTAQMSSKSLDENENGVAEATLLEGLYNGTDIQIKAINEDGDYLGVFLDDELEEDGSLARAEEDSAAVYYSIYSHEEGTWSKPVLLEDDGTVDQDLSIFDLGNRGILVTWSSANREFGNNQVTSRVDMMNAMDIHGCFFNKTSKTFGSVMKITKETEQGDFADYAGDVSPNVVYNDHSLLVYYTKNEYAVSSEEEGEVVGDVVYPDYSVLAYRQYDFSGSTGTAGQWIDDYGLLNDGGKTAQELREEYPDTYEDYLAAYYGQVFFDASPSCYIEEILSEDGFWAAEPEIFPRANWSGNLYESDGSVAEQEPGAIEEDTEIEGTRRTTAYYAPKILDTAAISYNDLGLLAYTVDYDQSMTTTKDRDVVLQIYDFLTGQLTHRIMVSCDQAADSDVQFVKVEDSAQEISDTYLTWISDGNIKAFNVSNAVRDDALIYNDEYGVYYINKAPDSQYEPITTLVESDINEETGEPENAVSSFDVQSTDGYVYLSWTQSETTLKDGVEENTQEAIATENQQVENQIYMARYDLAENMMTGKVQVTSEAGANYSNVSFVVNPDATLTALATKAKSKVVDAGEFNEIIDRYNETASEDEKMDAVSEDDFTGYAAPDDSNQSLVALQIRPVSVMKVKEMNLDELTEGEENMISFTLLNDGIDTLKDATLTVTDGDGQSILLEGTENTEDGVTTMDYQIVDSVTIDKLMGGNTYNGNALVTLDEHETSAEVKVRLTDADGEVLIEETYEKSLEEAFVLKDLTVKETEERDVYDVAFTVENDVYRYSAAKEATVGISTGDGDVTLATVPIAELEKGESGNYQATVTVDSAKQFAVSNEENGFVKETGTFFVKLAEATETQTVTRTASGAQMEQINGITDGRIGDGTDITVEPGDAVTVTANVKSSLANDELGTDGTEGIEVLWQTEDDSIASVDSSGKLTGLKEGTTTLKALIIPKASESVATVNESRKASDYNFGSDVSNYASLPNAAIKTYTIKVTVGDSGTQEPPVTEEPVVTEEPPATQEPPTTAGPPATEEPPATESVTKATKNGVTYEISGKNAVVSKAEKTVKTVAIPATVKIGGKSYKVTKIAAKAFQNCTKLKKVTIGKNVTTIGANAFKGCKKLASVTISKNVKSIKKNAFYGNSSLKKITFKGKTVPEIGKNAFKGISKKAIFKTPKKALKQYKKVLKKKTGVTKKMKIKA